MQAADGCRRCACLFGGSSQVFERRAVAQLQAVAVQIHEAQPKLGAGAPPIRPLAQPLDGRLVTGRHPQALGIHVAQLCLSLGVPCFGSPPADASDCVILSVQICLDAFGTGGRGSSKKRYMMEIAGQEQKQCIPQWEILQWLGQACWLCTSIQRRTEGQ